MWYFAVLAFSLSLLVTFLVKILATRLGVVDKPDHDRKLHGRVVALLGGVAIFISFWLVVAWLVFFHPIFGIEILKGKLFAAFLSGLVIMVIGVADEVRPLSAKFRLIVTSIAVIIAIILGINLEKITNPFGGVMRLSGLFGDVLVFIWLLGMMYTTKISDGLDGLSTGVVAIGSIVIFLLSTSAKFYQPNVALLAIIFAAVCLGFLIFNFHPASIYLGESGSLFVGFMLGVLAIISGGKVATALLVMGVPALDIARVVYMRIRGHQKIFQGDRRHLHYQLMSYGLKEWQVVIIYYAIAALLGALALFLQSSEKLIVFFVILLVMSAVTFRLPEMTK